MNKFEIAICWLPAWMGFIGAVALAIEWHVRRRSRLKEIFKRYVEKECPDCGCGGGRFVRHKDYIDICKRCEGFGWVRQIPNHNYKWWMGKLKPEITEDVWEELEDQYKI